jgi:hypothetical protein
MEIGQSAGKSYAYLLGVYMGDGCVYYVRGRRSGRFVMSAIDGDFVDATAEALKEVVGGPVWTKWYDTKGGRPRKTLIKTARDLCATLVADTEGKTKIPDYVFSWPKENRLAFIAGLMDSEGFVAVQNGSPTPRGTYMGFKACGEWVRQFVRVLEITGIRVGKVSDCPPLKAHYKVPTRFTIKMQSWIDAGGYFTIKRKQERVEAWAAFEPYTQRSRFPRRLSSETLRTA